jgi:hypothetical protein
MNELTKLLDAVRDSVRTLSALEDALQGFAERVSLQSTLDAFPVNGEAVAPDALDPCPTVEELQDILTKASGTLGVAKVREIIQDEAGGKKIVDMTDRERQLVRVSLELHGVKTR